MRLCLLSWNNFRPDNNYKNIINGMIEESRALSRRNVGARADRILLKGLVIHPILKMIFY